MIRNSKIVWMNMPYLNSTSLPVRVGADGDRHILEVDAADGEAEGRHDDVADERAHDLAERGADHDTDREVDDVALHRKFFEFRSESHGATP